MLRKKFLSGFLAVSMVVSMFGMNNFAFAATSPAPFNDINSWSKVAGTISQNDTGMTFSGTGSSGTLLESYYKTPFTTVDGFHFTLNLDSLGTVNGANNDSNFGIVLTDKQSQNYVWDATTKGLFLFFQPATSDADNYNFVVNTLYRTSGLGGVTFSNNSLTIDKNKGSVDILFMKDTGSNWHLFINGVDKGADLSAIKPVLDAGNLNFGIVATENKAATNNYAVRLSQINGIGTGRQKIFNSGDFIKSTAANISANQNLSTDLDGMHMTGSLTSTTGMNFKYGYNKPYKNLNGFSTNVNVTMDGTNGVNGSPNIDLALSSTGDGTINAARMDNWDYYGSPVTGARSLELKLVKGQGYYSTSIFVLGSNGQFDLATDIVAGAAIVSDANGNITISYVNNKNGSGVSDWTILANGRTIISNNALVNAELDALSISGACPVYEAGYDSIGTMTTVNATMLITDIGSTFINTTIPVTGITLNKSIDSLVVGSTDSLSATIAPSNATNQAVSWSSSNVNVATVSSSGLVTAAGTGTATITVATTDGNLIASCAVTAVPPVTFTNYKITGTNITNVIPGSSVDTFLAGLTVNGNTTVTVSNSSGEISGIATVGTGTTVDVLSNGVHTIYTIIIYGDVNSDGIIDLSDLVSIRNSLLGVTPLNGSFESAGELYNESTITLNDLVGIMASVSGVGNINQDPS